MGNKPSSKEEAHSVFNQFQALEAGKPLVVNGEVVRPSLSQILADSKTPEEAYERAKLLGFTQEMIAKIASGVSRLVL
ncbi:MAG: hypothetical protein WCJ19_00775 [bacterium]